MRLVDEKVRFAEAHIKNKEGVQWSLKGREWVRDEFWLPADGWKLWRYENAEPCEQCLDRVGEIISHPNDNPTTKCKCGGLCAEPILVTVLNLERGDGKTFNLMAYSVATLFKARNKSMSGLWASEDQGTRIFDENWRAAIQQDAALEDKRRCKISGTPPRIDALATGSQFEVLSVSHRSSTGGRRTHILIDEARDVPARTAMALLPSVNAMHGVECPSGHVQLTPEQVAKMKRVPSKCTACGRRLSEWWPRIILVSAAGIVSGNEQDWFYELVEELETTPHKNYHLFTSAKWGKPLNPRKSEKVTSAMLDVFGKLPSTRHYVAAEYGNQWTQPGEDVMHVADIKRVTDNSLENEEGSTNRAMGFLDTSETKEKTSMVILCEDPEASEKPWEHVYLSWLEFWWPGHGKQRAWRRIQEDVVQHALETVLPLYPNMVRFSIDTKLGARKEPSESWPRVMLRDIKKGNEAWRRKIEPWRGGADESDLGWDFFVARVTDEKIRLQKSKEIIDEVKGLMMRRPKQSDAKAKVVDRNRRQMHKDITQGLACACWLIKREQLKERRAPITREMTAKRAVTSKLRSGGTSGKRIRLGPDGW